MSSTSTINPQSSYYSVSIMLTENIRKNMFFSFPFTSTLTFNTFEEASSFVERHRSYFDNSFVTMKIYECFPVSDHSEGEFFEEEEECLIDLTGMKFTKYGKGYLLKPPSDYEFYGEKYFLGGWWKDTLDGWFFKKDQKEVLRSYGAKYKKVTLSKTNSSSKSSSSPKSSSPHSSLIEHCEWEEYGKGFLLIPQSEDHPDFGEKYYHGGWWMAAHNAWFFKKDAAQKFYKNQGKNFAETTDDSHTLTYKKLGKGHLFIPEKSHPDFGEKYYYNGFWMPAHDGWFFRKESDVPESFWDSS